MRPSRERWRVTRSGLAIAVLFTALAGSATPGDPALIALRERRYADADRNLNELYATRRESRAHTWALDTALERLGLAVAYDPALALRIDEWRRAKPKSAWPHLIRARHAVIRAWRARGDRYARAVPPAVWPIFYGEVEAADAALVAGLRADPKNSEVAAYRIETALLSPASPAIVARRFEEAKAIDPTSESAHRAMLRALAGQWHGSEDAQLAFARETQRLHPEAAILDLMVVDLHQWRAEARGEQQTYFRSPAVWAETSAALERYVAAFPEDPWGHNRLAWLAWRGGRKDVARRELALARDEWVAAAWDDDSIEERVRAWIAAQAPAPARVRGE